MKRIIVITILAVVMGSGFYTHADVVTPGNSSFYYIFHLYYDTDKLVPDRDFKFSYDIIPGDFIAEPLNTQFPYRGEVINMAGEISGRFVFDPKGGDIKFTKGKISVKAPYVADAQRVIFYDVDVQNQPVLTISVSESSFCNDDGVCNTDRGEDSLSCPKDCKQSLPAPPITSPTPSTGGSNGLWSGILYSLVGLILAGLGWWFLKRRGNSNNMTLPPTLPTLPLTPSVPQSRPPSAELGRGRGGSSIPQSSTSVGGGVGTPSPGNI